MAGGVAASHAPGSGMSVVFVLDGLRRLPAGLAQWQCVLHRNASCIDRAPDKASYMQTVSSTELLDEMKRRAVLVMFGSSRCSVCAAIGPRIEAMVTRQFPALPLAYVNCDEQTEMCAQHSVFSLPALKLFLSGTASLELARSFSLKEVEAGIERNYSLWQASHDAASKA